MFTDTTETMLLDMIISPITALGKLFTPTWKSSLIKILAAQHRLNSQTPISMKANLIPETVPESERTLFGKICRGEVPSTKVYEDEKCYAFRDIAPAAPIHILLIPKVCGKLSSLSKAEEDDKETLGHLMWAVGQIAKQENIGDFRVVINNGPRACQSVYHLHLHILGGRPFSWYSYMSQ